MENAFSPAFWWKIFRVFTEISDLLRQIKEVEGVEIDPAYDEN